MGKTAAVVADVPSFGGGLRIATTATIAEDSAASEDIASSFAMGDTGNTAVPAGNYCYCSCSFPRQMETIRGLYEIWVVNGSLLHGHSRPSGFFSRATVHITTDYFI